MENKSEPYHSKDFPNLSLWTYFIPYSSWESFNISNWYWGEAATQAVTESIWHGVETARRLKASTDLNNTVFILTVMKKWIKSSTLQSGGLHLLKFLRHTISEFVFILWRSKTLEIFFFRDRLHQTSHRDPTFIPVHAHLRHILARLSRQFPPVCPRLYPSLDVLSILEKFLQKPQCAIFKNSLTALPKYFTYVSLSSPPYVIGLICMCQVADWTMRFLFQLKTTYLLK